MADNNGDVFAFAFSPSYRRAGLLFGITPRTAWVRLGEGGSHDGGTARGHRLRVRYGPWRLQTPVDNIVSAQRTGGFSWVKTAGPPHLSFADRGISFTTNGEDAVCLTFRQPVPGIDPLGAIRHPGATVSVEDPERFLARLAELGVPTHS